MTLTYTDWEKRRALITGVAVIAARVPREQMRPDGPVSFALLERFPGKSKTANWYNAAWGTRL